ncbi:unnamed protein product, partial [Rotaria sp. Silwood2]
MQQIIDSSDISKELFTFKESTIETDEELSDIMHDERKNPTHFDLEKGLVFRCHVVYYKRNSNKDRHLCEGDALIFNFHHALFDFLSLDVFHQDLNQAYTTGQLPFEDDSSLRYIDYAVIEQQMPMTAASTFWLDALRDYKIDRPLPLPYDRYGGSHEHRTDRGLSASFDFGEDLSRAFLARTSMSEAVPRKLVSLVREYIPEKCRIWNLYGPAEISLGCTYHVVDLALDQTIIPIGRPLPHYRCLIHDEFDQLVIVGQQGELLVGGVGVFAGYLGRDDLTTKALVEIDGVTYYRTGDLVRMDSSGLIYYIGRQDHQVKLHGQRIEVDEIERCLLDTHITACVVVKFGEDHLVAYVQGSGISEEDLRTHCRSRLPPFMIPSMFVVLDHLPLNANGKVDRKHLPIPDFSSLSTSSSIIYQAPRTEMEERVHDLWCK